MSAMPTDRLQRFIFDDTQVRGDIAQLHSTYQQAIANHGYPLAVERLLAEVPGLVLRVPDWGPRVVDPSEVAAALVPPVHRDIRGKAGSRRASRVV